MRKVTILMMVMICQVEAISKDYYASMEGAGIKDGSNWENAIGMSEIDNAVNKMEDSGSIYLAGGVYKGMTLKINDVRNENASIAIVGVDRGDGLPRFVGEWSIDKPSKGATAIEIETGVSNVTLANIEIERYMRCIYISAKESEKTCRKLVFDNIMMSYCRHGFYISNCDEVHILNCKLRRYSKHGFRLQGNCNNVRMVSCMADCSEGDGEWEKKTEALPFGFTVSRSERRSSNISFVNCVAKNNMMPLQKNKYKNGDGFVVERNAEKVTFAGCISIRNQDGGFDLKTKDVSLKDCVSMWNHRCYRIWNGGKLENCFAGWSDAGLWSNGAAVSADNMTFYEMAECAIDTGDKCSDVVAVKDSIVARCRQMIKNTANGKVLHENCVIEGEQMPAIFAGADGNWDGTGINMNCVNYPDKGYRKRDDGEN